MPRPLKFGRPAGNLFGMDPALVPYDDMREYRAKYGYGNFARDLYPDDLDVSLPASPPNPNTAIRHRGFTAVRSPIGNRTAAGPLEALGGVDAEQRQAEHQHP